MQRCKYVFANDAFVDHNRILEVIALPWHEGHQHVLTQGQFTFLSLRNLRRGFVLPSPLRPFLTMGLRFMQVPWFVRLNFGISNTFTASSNDTSSSISSLRVYESGSRWHPRTPPHRAASERNNTRGNLSPLAFQTSTDDWRSRAHQGHSLTHHVRSHQCTVGVIVLQKWNQRGCNRSDLVRCNVHIMQLVFWLHREVPF